MCYTFGFILLVAVCLYVVSFCYVLLCVCVFKNNNNTIADLMGFCVCERVSLSVCVCARVSVCLSVWLWTRTKWNAKAISFMK